MILLSLLEDLWNALIWDLLKGLKNESFYACVFKGVYVQVGVSA